MDRIIKQITEYFFSQLPEVEGYYRVKDLEEHHFPAFLIQRIHLELKWNLEESMVLPQTDWARMQSKAVQKSWQQFLNAIHAEVKLPVSYAKAVIETAVTDIIEMLVEPRQNITTILYGGADVLSAAELQERTELLVVYPHFAHVLTSYMKRKNKDKLSRSRCEKIISRIDEKVTHQYTSLQWAQMLDPLFTLLNSTVDTSLLRLFFEDREMQQTARKFEGMDSSITQAQFIEVLSSPELSDYDEYDEDLAGLFEDDGATDQRDQEVEVSPDDSQNSEKSDDDKSESFSEPKEPEPADTSFSDFETNIKESDIEWMPEQETEDETDEVTPLPDFEITPEEKRAMGQENDPALLNDIFSNEEEKSPPDEESDLSERQPAAPVVDEPEKETDEEESSIWMHFMGSEESKTDENEDADFDLSDKKSNTETVQENEVPHDEASIDLAKESLRFEPKKERLEKLLKDRKTYFIKELFNDSEQAYEESLQKIAKEDDWEWASKLIANNIFKRYDINIYSRAAIDFTDRMQNFFLNK